MRPERTLPGDSDGSPIRLFSSPGATSTFPQRDTERSDRSEETDWARTRSVSRRRCGSVDWRWSGRCRSGPLPVAVEQVTTRRIPFGWGSVSERQNRDPKGSKASKGSLAAPSSPSSRRQAVGGLGSPRGRSRRIGQTCPGRSPNPNSHFRIAATHPTATTCGFAGIGFGESPRIRREDRHARMAMPDAGTHPARRGSFTP
jgi:hypothetical protein